MVGPSNTSSISQLNTALSYQLDAFICDESFVPTNLPFYQQGDVIKICVKPDKIAEIDGLSMKQIDSMTFKKAGIDDYFAVYNGMDDFHGFSESSCKSGNPICWVDTLLKAEWFAEEGIVEVYGVASLQFESRRSLKNMDDVKTKNGEERGKFSTTFPVLTFQE